MKALVSGVPTQKGSPDSWLSTIIKELGRVSVVFAHSASIPIWSKCPDLFLEKLFTQSLWFNQCWLWNLATPIRVIQSIIIFDENYQGISLCLLKRETFLFSVGSLTVRIYTWWPSCLPTCPRMKKTQRKAELRVKMANIPDIVWVHRPDCAWSQHFYGITNLNEYKA